jgi:HEPN domain-containing protein
MMEMGVEETIYGWPFYKGLLGIFVNTENPKEAIHVLVLCAEIPSYQSIELYSADAEGFVHTKKTRESWLYKCSADNLIEKLNKDENEKIMEIESSSVERISDFTIIDPLLFRACKEEINSLKQEIEDKIGKNILYHPSEFLSMLAIDRTEFDAEWSGLRAKALEILKEDYEFLVLYEEKEVIHEAQKDMKEAEIDIEEEKYRDSVGKAGRACEGMLRVLYYAYKKKPAEERASLDSMLNELREEILDDFGDDVFNDLNYIRQWRNAAVHPRPQEIKPEIAVKVIRKAQLFQELFFLKMKGRL